MYVGEGWGGGERDGYMYLYVVMCVFMHNMKIYFFVHIFIYRLVLVFDRQAANDIRTAEFRLDRA